MTLDIERMLAQDNREKRMARGGLATSKKRPGTLIMPTDLKGRSREPPYSWREARPIVRVDIQTGRILIFRWPIE